MDHLLQDLRYALRTLTKAPAFTGVALGALALGIGVNTAVFSIVSGVLLKPLAYAEPDRLVAIASQKADEPEKTGTVAYPTFVDWRSAARSFDGMASYASGTLTVTGQGNAEALQTAFVSPSLLPLLRVAPEQGRLLLDRDNLPGAGRVALISHRLWDRRFNLDPAIIGRSAIFDSQAVTIVGVLPRTFEFPLQPEPVDVWVPLVTSSFTDGMIDNRNAHFLDVIARLNPVTALEQARADMWTVNHDLAVAHPDSDAGRTVNLVPFRDQVVGDIRPALLVLLGAVAFVLLIACANVANLLLARAAARQREMAVRTALGATRGRLLRQLLTESLILSLGGGTLGLLFALWGVDALVALVPPGMPRLHEVGVDVRVLLFTLAISVATGVLFGLVPAVQSSHGASAGLKDATARGGTGHAASRMRSLMVVSEVALALMLLVGATLMVRSFFALSRVSPGFATERILTVDLSLPDGRYGGRAPWAAFADRIASAASALPDARSAAVASTIPLGGSDIGLSYSAETQPTRPADRRSATFYAVSADYFRTMGIALVRGRTFTDRDRAGSAPVIIVNETMARRLVPNGDPLGRPLTIGYSKPLGREIVGIVRDVRPDSLADEPGPQMYTPFSQTPWPFMTLVVRTDGPPDRIRASLRSAVLAVDRDLPVNNMTTIEQYVTRSVSRPRFTAMLVGAFGILALVLAALGIYGVMAFLVAQRTREIGIRVALGARPRDVITMVVAQGMRPTLVGLAIGVLGALSLTRLLGSLLFGISPTDPMTFGAVAAGLALAAMAASYLPARRALAVDPVVALRQE